MSKQPSIVEVSKESEPLETLKKDKIVVELRNLENLLAELRLKTNVITKEEFVTLIGKSIRTRDNLEDLLK